MRFLHLGSLVAVLFAVSGCHRSDQPEIGEVHGIVTLDGKPLANATVMYQPADGRPSMGVTDAAGRYDLIYTRKTMGARVGSHVVNIRTRLEDNSGKVIVKEFLPKRYHDKTELQANVVAGSNTIDFPLTSAP